MAAIAYQLFPKMKVYTLVLTCNDYQWNDPKLYIYNVYYVNFTLTVSTTGLSSTLGTKFSNKCFAPDFRDVVDFSSSLGMFSPSSVYVLCVSVCVLMRLLLYMIFIKLELFVNPKTLNRKHTLSYINKCKCLHLLVTLWGWHFIFIMTKYYMSFLTFPEVT